MAHYNFKKITVVPTAKVSAVACFGFEWVGYRNTDLYLCQGITPLCCGQPDALLQENKVCVQ